MFKNIVFNPAAFIETLPYMGKGMLGIFIVIAIIVVAVYALGAFGKTISKDEDK